MTMQLVERPTAIADTVRLTAGPFNTFSQIVEFQNAVARPHGVSGIRAQSARRARPAARAAP
jgi:hypothetical protein